MKTHSITLAMVLGACQPGSSELTPELRAEQYGNSVRLSASFQEGSDPVTALDGEFKATFRGETKVLEHNFPAFWYASFELDTSFVADEPITYDLTIEGEPTTSLTFELAALEIDPVPLFVARADNLTLSWSPSVEYEMGWQLTVCGSGAAYGRIPANVTSYTVPKESFRNDITCTAELEIEHRAIAPIDSAFAGGTFQLDEHPRVWFASTP